MSKKTKKEVFDSIVDWKTPKEVVFNWEPFLYRILVKVDPPKETKSLIAIPEEFKRRESMGREIGTILDIGDCCFQGYKTEKHLQIGDRIVFQKYAGMMPNPEDTTLRVINDNDVIVKDNN